MTQFKGIDVSYSNGAPDWEKVKADGIEFAMIRLGYGSDIPSQDDAQFERNVAECERLGIHWGPYLYSYALNVADAKSETAHVLRKLAGKHPTLPFGFDMEDADGYKAKHGMPSDEVLVDICYEVLSGVEAAGYPVRLYSMLNWLNTKLNSPKLDRFGKWVAQWNTQCDYVKPYDMWQYTNSGTVNGISGRVDMDYSYIAFGGQAASTPAPTKMQYPVQPVSTGNPIGAQVEVIADVLNCRQHPDINSPVLFQAKKGQVFNVTANINDWHEVIIDNNGHNGYLFGNNGQFLSLIRDTPQSAAPTPKSRKIFLPADNPTWTVYKLGHPCVKSNPANIAGVLKPAKFGGLTYDILKDNGNGIYEIQTGDFGRVQIYGAPSTGAKII